MSVKVGIRNYKQSVAELKSMQGKSRKVIDRLMSDVRTRAPGWIASEVVKEYNIKKREITPSKAGKASKTAGSIKVQGDTVKTMQLVYTGRMLTPIHFGMTPKAPRQTYTLKAEIIKGQKVALGGKKKKLTKKQRAQLGKNFTRQGVRTSPRSPAMLMPTGTTYIPFQRKSVNRKDIEAIKTISMPQMVSSPRTQDGITRVLNENLEKRMNQHMKIMEK